MPQVQPLTEEDYWKDYAIIRDDVFAAIVACHTYNAVHDLVAKDPVIRAKVNQSPDFWSINAFSWQTTLFIVLARILDNGSDAHTVHTLLNATIAHPEFFARNALRKRKLSTQGAPWQPGGLDQYVAHAWEPTTSELRALKTHLKPHVRTFEEIYKPLRNTFFAHRLLKDQAQIADLFSKTLRQDFDDMLCCLHTLIRAIWQMAHNAKTFQLSGDHYGYAVRVNEVRKATEDFLRQLAYPPALALP